MRILVTGITGAIGSGLAPRLLDAGHDVRALTRRRDGPALAQVPAGVRLETGDAVSGIGLEPALEGVEVAYYLIHSMEPGSDEHFGVRERRAAENFAAAASAAGVQRIVYLGGLVPQDAPSHQVADRSSDQLGGRPSEHLASRLAVERVLLDAIPDSVAIR